MEANQQQQNTGAENTTSGQAVQVSELRRQVRDLNGVNTRIGFSEKDGFELMFRVATMISRSDLVPDLFRDMIEVKKGANKGTLVKNHSGVSNAMLALNVATKLDMDVLMVMGNMMAIEGRLSWSSQFVIAAVSRSQNFTAIRYDVVRDSAPTEYEYVGKEWDDHANRYNNVKKKVTLINRTCVAWAIEKETGERVESPEVSLEMAVKEGWYGKRGSKWQTMPDVMLRYRAASFFGKLYAPDMLMGMPSEDEMQDMIADDARPGQGYSQESGAGQPGGSQNSNSENGVKETAASPEKQEGKQPEKSSSEETQKPNGQQPREAAPARGSNRMDLRKNNGVGSESGGNKGGISTPNQNNKEQPPMDDFETMTDEQLLEHAGDF